MKRTLFAALLVSAFGLATAQTATTPTPVPPTPPTTTPTPTPTPTPATPGANPLAPKVAADKSVEQTDRSMYRTDRTAAQTERSQLRADRAAGNTAAVATDRKALNSDMATKRKAEHRLDKAHAATHAQRGEYAEHHPNQ